MCGDFLYRNDLLTTVLLILRSISKLILFTFFFGVILIQLYSLSSFLSLFKPLNSALLSPHANSPVIAPNTSSSSSTYNNSNNNYNAVTSSASSNKSSIQPLNLLDSNGRFLFDSDAGILSFDTGTPLDLTITIPPSS